MFYKQIFRLSLVYILEQIEEMAIASRNQIMSALNQKQAGFLDEGYVPFLVIERK